MQVVAEGKREALELIARGERLTSGSPSPEQIASFMRDEEIWRTDVTRWMNFFLNNEWPDVGPAGMKELLLSDEFGGRLKELRRRLGG